MEIATRQSEHFMRSVQHPDAASDSSWYESSRTAFDKQQEHIL
jgi:hypothetical protein